MPSLVRRDVGKSTLLNIIGTLDTPSEGKVIVGGTSTGGLSEKEISQIRSRQFGFIFQMHHLLPQCTALENVLVPTLALADKPDAEKVLEQPDVETKSKETTDAPLPKKKIPVKVGPDDKFDRGVPRTSVASYTLATKENDFERAVNYLDLRNLPRGYSQKDGPELARQLKVVLDRALWIDLDILSIDTKGHSDDGLPSYQDLVGQIETGDRKYDILMQRIPRGDGVYIWMFSSKTVRNIPKLYAEHGYGPIGEELSQAFPSESFMGLEFWQWIFVALIIVSATLVSFPFVRLASWLVRRKRASLSDVTSRFINGPLHVLIVVILMRHFFDEVHPSLEARAIFQAGTISIIIGTWVIFRVVDLFRDFWVLRLTQDNKEHAVVLIKPAMTALNIFVVVIAFLVWLDNIGFSITTVIAGLGIGGIAIALATQKSIEHFIGALTLYVAAPVRVGDFCRVGDNFGTVEEIGLRATKLRTLANTVLVIPNADFAGMPIENFAGRESYRFHPKINLRIDTSPDQIRFILIELQKLLHAHSRVADSPRARFTGFGSHSLDIDIHCYLETQDYAEHLAIGEDLNLRIMDIIRSAGTEIAIPARLEFQDTAPKLNQADKDKVEAQIAKINAQGQLDIELTEQQIAEINNTIPYPSKGN